MTTYTLPDLPYTYDALEPHYDAKTVEIHHSLHHKKYVDDANSAQQKLKAMRESGDFSNYKAVYKALAFNVSGAQLHNLFWENLSPAGSDEVIDIKLLEKINEDFGNLENMKAEFTAASTQVEGSGWGLLALRTSDNTLVITQIEKHQDLVEWHLVPILICDVWEHAYYLKYQNRRPEWMQNFWPLVNWTTVANRFSAA